jgi:SAM-dependent methyltransferase
MAQGTRGVNADSFEPDLASIIAAVIAEAIGAIDMDHREVGRYWNENADDWTRLVRRGLDIYRDGFNTPAFFEVLPDVRGLQGVDIGCGEGHNTRLLAQRGARMTGIDIAERFIEHARHAEAVEPHGIDYRVASAVELPFPDATFDFAAAFMSFMDIPETQRVVAEAFRILKPGGFLQFSIAHPCFDTPHRRNLRNERGLTYALEIGDYFRNQEGEVDEWTFSGLPPEDAAIVRKFRSPRFTRTLSQWLNLLIGDGFRLEYVAEPRPSAEAVRRWPNLQDATVVAYFLHVRARK